MLSSPRIKMIRSLKDKKFRDQLGLFVVEGEKLVQEALESSFSVEEVFRAEEIGMAAMERISLLSSPSPVLAIVRKSPPQQSLPKLREGGLYLALDDIRDPGNMGTIIRTADWFGLDGIFASERSVDIYNPKVIQSTMGAIFRIPVHYCDLQKLLPDNPGAHIWGTFLSGSDLYRTDILPGPHPNVIVVGNESNGICEAVGECCTDRITIPPFARSGKGSESLNAAVATSIVVSEFRRRGL